MPQPQTQNQNQNKNALQAQNNLQQQTKPIKQEILDTIRDLKGFKTYPIRKLVEQTEKFGDELNRQKLETNQVRKFLDAINRLKSDLAQNQNEFSAIETEVVLLKPKLAYAAARQQAAKPLSEVMSKAIDQVKDEKDFNRLVQFVESIIAYHKAAGGK